jgi:hypothetical protein
VKPIFYLEHRRLDEAARLFVQANVHTHYVPMFQSQPSLWSLTYCAYLDTKAVAYLVRDFDLSGPPAFVLTHYYLRTRHGLRWQVPWIPALE